MFEKLWEEFRFGLRNLRRYKLRTFLTTLGIIFGISSVMTMMAVGGGARAEILEKIQQLGINNIIVNTVKPPESTDATEKKSWTARYGLTFRDLRQIQETSPEVERALAIHFVKKPVWYGSRKLNTKVLGVPPEYLETFHLKPERGRVFTHMDDQRFHRVCLIREGMLRKLGILEDPLHLSLRIGGELFQIVGVLPSKDYDSPTSKALQIEGQASEIYIPYKTVLKVFGTLHTRRQTGSVERTQIELDQIIVMGKNENRVFEMAQGISRILEKFHKEKDYELIVPLELLAQREQTQKVFNIVMLLIAGISLLVGGIGIANIMLATISERTREIGIRRAVGARKREIATQFLMETLAMAVMGGVAGCLLGFLGIGLISYYTGWPTILSPLVVVLSMSISCAVGIVFGLYPAIRAAKMDPIVALRYE